MVAGDFSLFFLLIADLKCRNTRRTSFCNFGSCRGILAHRKNSQLRDCFSEVTSNCVTLSDDAAGQRTLSNWSEDDSVKATGAALWSANRPRKQQIMHNFTLPHNWLKICGQQAMTSNDSHLSTCGLLSRFAYPPFVRAMGWPLKIFNKMSLPMAPTYILRNNNIESSIEVKRYFPNLSNTISKNATYCVVSYCKASKDPK